MNDITPRVLSGMRPTGKNHLGGLHGALDNWIKLQSEYDCYFAIVDWHAITTHYETTENVEDDMWTMLTEWFAVGLDPKQCSVFIQSWVPEHAELHLLLSMITPLSWLERVPTYKDQQQKMQNRDLNTYGFLGYPLLQSADILIYNAHYVPVGEDQVAHIEIAREIARRFNHFFGRDADFDTRVKAALKMLGADSKKFEQYRKAYQEQGDANALKDAQVFLNEHNTLPLAEQSFLYAHLVGSGRMILREPEALLTESPRVPGTDGKKMSKSGNNAVFLRDDPDAVAKKLKSMVTDPARVRREDPGNPEKCPVWDLHKIYSDESTKKWVDEGCRQAGIGCIECKQCVVDQVNERLVPIQSRIKELDDNQDWVRNVVVKGSEKARDITRDTMKTVRRSMKLEY